ncbi:transcriptional regulator TbsP [Halalkalicoccus tibetensis]|uniref:Transcriptional regulator TbsP n=1 Tax=Halalkalicoccus tibetensis TaxID=175632 RepID=A0ABD5V3Z9_9EURY
MASNLLDDNIEDILRTVLESGSEDLIVVNPSADAIEELVDVAGDVSDPPRIRLLGDEGTLKTVTSDFILASNAADLVDDDSLSLRSLENGNENSLLVSPEEVVALINVGDTVAGLTTDDEEFVTLAYDAYTSTWEDAAEFNLRTPALSRVRTSLTEEIGEPVEDDFTGVLDSLQTARGDGNGLDEVTISLLVAAKNEVLLYDISKWGEDVGIASKATFSRTKTRLEDMGLIDTEKVPIDVGRPRLRLKFGDERLREANTDQLASVAQNLLN